MGVMGDGDLKGGLIRHLFVAEADHSRLSPPSGVVVDPVQIHEVDQSVLLVSVGDTVRQPGPNEGEMGVRVEGLLASLLLAQLPAELKLIVPVVGARREEVLEGLDVGLQGIAVVVESGAETRVKIAGRRMVGIIEGLGVPRGELVPKLVSKLFADVDNVYPGPRR